MYKILNTGEILKGLREKIGASQTDIKGVKTRSYISEIEHGAKAPKSTIEYIYNNIVDVAKEKDINLEMTLDDLLQTDEEKIDKVCEEIITDIKTCKMKNCSKENIDLLVNDINSFVKKYKVSDIQQCEIYEGIANLYLSENIQFETQVYSVKTLELSFKSNNYEYVLKLIYSMTNEFMKISKDDLISFIGTYAYSAYDRIEDKNNDIFKRIFFNVAKANRRIGNIKESIMYIKLIEDNFILTANQKYELKILKGCCETELHNYTQAESIFLSLLNEATDKEDSSVVSLTYINLSEIKLKTNNKNKSREYLKKACEYKVNERYESTIKFLSLKLYIELDELNTVNRMYDEVIKILVKDKDEDSLYIILNRVVEYFISKKENNPLNIIANLVYNYIMRNEIKNRKVCEVLFIISNYMIDVDINIAKNISSLCNKCITKFKQNSNKC